VTVFLPERSGCKDWRKAGAATGSDEAKLRSETGLLQGGGALANVLGGQERGRRHESEVVLVGDAVGTDMLLKGLGDSKCCSYSTRTGRCNSGRDVQRAWRSALGPRTLAGKAFPVVVPHKHPHSRPWVVWRLPPT
jgi:hypothetical protein